MSTLTKAPVASPLPLPFPLLHIPPPLCTFLIKVGVSDQQDEEEEEVSCSGMIEEAIYW